VSQSDGSQQRRQLP